MAKYGKFDPRNKKSSKDKYRSDKKSNKNASQGNRSVTTEKLKEIERKYNV